MRKDQLTSMTVSLSTGQKAWVKRRAKDTGCATPSEYIRRLIQSDKQARESELLEAKLLASLESPAREMSDAEWQKLRSTVVKNLAKRRS